MYAVELEPEAQAQTLALSFEDLPALAEVLAVLEVDPWNYRRRPDEPAGPHFAHRTVEFARGRGLLTFLILEHAAEVHVTRITWLG